MCTVPPRRRSIRTSARLRKQHSAFRANISTRGRLGVVFWANISTQGQLGVVFSALRVSVGTRPPQLASGGAAAAPRAPAAAQYRFGFFTNNGDHEFARQSAVQYVLDLRQDGLKFHGLREHIDVIRTMSARVTSQAGKMRPLSS